MGFLSINYGILLQWGRGNKGEALVNLVVLRKMVPSSFMSVQYQNRPGHLNVDRLAMIFCEGWCNVNTTDESYSKSYSHVENPYAISDTEKRDHFTNYKNGSSTQINNEKSLQANKHTSLILRDIVDDTDTAILESVHSSEMDDEYDGPSTEVTF